MADIKSPEERSRNMSAIKRADTKPEIHVRKLLFNSGYRYRLQVNTVPGHLDLWMRKYNVAIFIHGCFWHRHNGCKQAYTPKSKIDFWNNKFEKNIRRDQEVLEQLKEHNVRCMIIWECTIRQAQKKNGDPEKLKADIEQFLLSDRQYSEL